MFSHCKLSVAADTRPRGTGVLVTALADDAVTLGRRLHETDASTGPRGSFIRARFTVGY